MLYARYPVVVVGQEFLSREVTSRIEQMWRVEKVNEVVFTGEDDLLALRRLDKDGKVDNCGHSTYRYTL